MISGDLPRDTLVESLLCFNKRDHKRTLQNRRQLAPDVYSRGRLNRIPIVQGLLRCARIIPGRNKVIILCSCYTGLSTITSVNRGTSPIPVVHERFCYEDKCSEVAETAEVSECSTAPDLVIGYHSWLGTVPPRFSHLSPLRQRPG